MRAITFLLLLVTGCAAMTTSNAPGMTAPPLPCTTTRAQPSAAGFLALAGGTIAVGGAVTLATADRGNEPDSEVDEAIRTFGGLGLIGVGVLGLVAAAAVKSSSTAPTCAPPSLYR